MDFSIERNRREVTTHSAGPAHRSPFRARIQEGCGAHHMPAEAEYSGTVGAGLDPELQSMRNFAAAGPISSPHAATSAPKAPTSATPTTGRAGWPEPRRLLPLPKRPLRARPPHRGPAPSPARPSHSP